MNVISIFICYVMHCYLYKRNRGVARGEGRGAWAPSASPLPLSFSHRVRSQCKDPSYKKNLSKNRVNPFRIIHCDSVSVDIDMIYFMFLKTSKKLSQGHIKKDSWHLYVHYSAFIFTNADLKTLNSNHQDSCFEK